MNWLDTKRDYRLGPRARIGFLRLLRFSGNIVGDMWTFLLAKFSRIYKGFVGIKLQVRYGYRNVAIYASSSYNRENKEGGCIKH